MTLEVRTTSVRELVTREPEASFDFVHADPPWRYRDTGCRGGTKPDYDGVPMPDIVDDLAAAYRVAKPDTYLVVWVTGPMVLEFFGEVGRREGTDRAFPWGYINLGGWVKEGRLGSGYHWRGDLEPPTLWRKGKPKPQGRNFRNVWHHQRLERSEKPVPALYEIVRMASPHRGRVIDLYAGRTASMARACSLSGRSYLGAELDPRRAAQARAAIEAMCGDV